MPLVNVNFDDVSEEYPTIKPGIYEAQVIDVIRQDIDTSRGQAAVLDVQLQITHADDPDNEDSTGLRLTDRYFLDNLSDRDKTKLKRLALSAGVTPGADGLDTEELRDATVRCRVRLRTRKGSDREFPDVADYLTE